ncbi:hypothetical protein BDR06DRAFT_1000799 [Suillus hirtellus]|nr:hypothetical protein BDR06DRAFT_1000799 [Suillus hirtellus]
MSPSDSPSQASCKAAKMTERELREKEKMRSVSRARSPACMEEDGRATPTPSRLHSPSCSFNQADEEMVAKPLAERGAGHRTSHAPSALDPAIEIVDPCFRLNNCLDHLFKPILANITTLYKLIFSAYIKPSTLLSHHSPRDKRIKYEAEEKIKIAGSPTAKELREVQETAEARLKREEEEAESVGLKRKPEDLISHRSSKDDVYFRVNFDKFNTHIRNKASGDRQKNPTSTAAITILISADDDLSTGLVSSTKKASRASLVKDNLGLMYAVDNPTPAGKAVSFISVADNIDVEFEIVSKCLRRRVPKAVARERHGDVGVRIQRWPRCQITLSGHFLRLSFDFLISTQEVLRSADRNPTRTFYLWYLVFLFCQDHWRNQIPRHVDPPKAYSVLLGHLYKTLYNIGLRFKIAFADTLTRLLHSIGKAEVDHPQWEKAIEKIYPRAKKMMSWVRGCDFRVRAYLIARFIPERHMSKVAIEEPSTHGPASDDIPLFLDLESVFGMKFRVLRIDRFASPFSSVGRHVANASLSTAVVNIPTVFRLERAPGWNVGPDAEGVKWTGGLTT